MSGKPETVKELASRAARARWAKVSADERSRVMKRMRRGLKYRAKVRRTRMNTGENIS